MGANGEYSVISEAADSVPLTMAHSEQPNLSMHTDGDTCTNGDTHTSSSARKDGHTQANGSSCHGAQKKQENKDPAYERTGAKDEASPQQDKVVPIAVVGMALTFPQDATSPEAFWEMLKEGRSALSEIPNDRLNRDAFVASGDARFGMFKPTQAHFLKEDIGAFDAPFFSIKPQEAACMDPQQRLSLETAYQALENAGVPMEKAVGTNTSVHIGSFMHDYENMLMRDPQLRGTYTSVGTGGAVLANRISWFYNLKGPSLMVDTACSSSLTALHLACQGLRSGESDMGLVGGCNVFFDPAVMADIQDMGILSPTGVPRCFDRKANGYSRGEGIGMVVLKRLSDALEAGDCIRGVIRATGIGSDGWTPGITRPSGTAQASLIRKVYEEAGLDPSNTMYFEAHGTGAPVGDLLEARAIQEGMRRSQSDPPLYVGAVKSNIGHLEGAAGIAGFIKTVLTLEKGIIPPNLWFEEPNRKILCDEWNIKFPTKATPWPVEGLRRASQNSFGFGGSNAHAVVDDAANYLRLHNLAGRHRTCTTNHGEQVEGFTDICSPYSTLGAGDNVQHCDNTPRLLVWSASDNDALTRLIARYEAHFTKLLPTLTETGYLERLSYTLSEKRSNLPWRTFHISGSLNDLKDNFPAGLVKHVRSTRDPRLGFVFTGQGAQWALMGLELLEIHEYRSRLEDADRFFRKLGSEWSLLGELQKVETSSRISNPLYAQPVSTVVQTTLVDLLSHWGIKPSVVVGHSSGEIAAAYCAGAISRQSAWTLAYYRGLVSAGVLEDYGPVGTMVSIDLSEAEVAPLLPTSTSIEDGEYATVACINSPKNVTVSGSKTAIDNLCARLEVDNVPARRLQVDVAYHSRYMANAASKYERLIHNIQPQQPCPQSMSMVSSVTGLEISFDELCKPEYWVRNMTSPVRFSDAAARMCVGPSADEDHFSKLSQLIEIGPHSALRRPLREILNAENLQGDIGYSSLLMRGQNAIHSTLNVAGLLHCSGYPVDLYKVNRLDQSRTKPSLLPDLPQYPFDHSRRYWLEGPNNKAFRFRKHNSHEILGIPAADWNEQEPRWCNSISMSSASWIQDHQVNNTVVFPAAGMITMAIEAATQIADSSMQIVGFQLQDVVFRKALIIPATGSVATQLSIQASSHENTDLSLGRTFRVYFSEGDEWVEACEGRISIEYGETQPVDGQYNGESNIGCASGFQEESLAQTTAANVEELYTRFKTIGLEYGPAFQRLHDVHVAGNGHATARVNLFNDRFQKADDRTQRYAVHPAALDVMLQVALVSLTSIKDHNFSTPVISRVPSLYIPSTGLSTEDASIEIRARCEVRSERAIDAAFHGSKTSNPTLRVNGSLQITSLEGGPDVPSTEHPLKQFCHKVAWKPDPNLLNKDSTLDYCLRGVTGTKKPHFSVMTEEKLQLILLTILDARDAGPDLEKLFHEKPWFRTYFEWIEHAISVNLGGNNDGHVAIAELKAKGADKQSMTQIHDQVLATGSSGELLVRVAKNHAAMLKGSVDPLTLLFGDGLMTEVYKELHDNNPAFGQLAVYLDVLAHQNPSAKVLEIGAGTGGTTKEILDTLACESLDDRSKVSKMPRFSEFVFTDISSVFFENAKERFSNSLDRMRFATLNIEKEPIDQGFEAASYDIIVASNVLHATANLSVTLENARKLLKPGGKLILYECVDPTSLFHNFVLGLLSGWWLSSEPERKYSPLVEESRWNTYLTDAGFSGIDLSFREHETDHEGGSSVMISTSPSAPVQPSNVSEVVIIADQTSQRQVGLADLVTSTLLETDHVECKMIELSHTTEDVLSEKTCITLLDMDQPFLDNVSDEKLEGLQTLFRAAKGIIWASGNSSSNPFRNLVTGLSRDQWLDRPDLKLVTVALEDPSAVSNCARHVAAIYHHSFLTGSSEYESDYSEQGGRLCISRLVNASSVNKHIHVQSGPPQPTPRVLSGQDRRALALDLKLYHQNGTIQFGEKEPADPLAPDEIEYVTKAISLDTTSLDRGESTIGQAITLGCAGVVRGTGENCALKIGDRICCLTNSGITTMGRCTASTAVQLPDELSFRDAASTPVDYCMAFLALDYWARIRTGDSVLVKSGATPAGQACIRYAGLFTDKVYVSVDNEEERKLIIEHLAVPQEHVLSARPSMLKDSIMSVTRGRGVSIMICPPGTTLSGRQVELLAPFGRLVQHGLREMGPSDLTAKNVMVATVNLAETINQNPALIKEALSTVMDLIRQRKLQPVSVPDTYNIANLATALASIKSARVSRRVAVELNAGETVTVLPRSTPSLIFPPDATYVIAGGLGGLGRSIALWMSSHGAKNLILLSRSGPRSPASRALLSALTANGTSAATPSVDIGDRDALSAALSSCLSTMPPIRGCVQAAMSLHIIPFAHESSATLARALDPKVAGSWNLHTLLPADVDFFVMLSSLAATVGQQATPAYNMGCAYQDGLAQYRAARGLHGVSLALGPMLEDGYVVEAGQAYVEAKLQEGFAGMSRVEFEALLGWHCDAARARPGVGDAHVVCGLRGLRGVEDRERGRWYWKDLPLVKSLWELEEQGAGKEAVVDEEQEKGEVSFKARVEVAMSWAEVAEAVLDAVRGQVAKTMGVGPTEIEVEKPLIIMGVDSLMAVEIKNFLWKSVGVDVSVLELLNNRSVKQLCAELARRSDFAKL